MRLFGFMKKKDTDEEDDIPIAHTRTFSSVNFRLEKTIGWKLRDCVGYIEKTLGPYLKKIFPNFVSVHYFYIITMSFTASVILYPYKNIDYIDALFMGACASTQAGLNPVDINDLKLYQQVVIYIFCTLTTPIFIHSGLAFLRLYWFERHFDNIRETSKLNYKMRRTATLAARTQSMERQRTRDPNFIERSKSRFSSRTGNSAQMPSGQQASPYSKPFNGTSSSSSALQNESDLEARSYTNDVEHVSEPSSDNESERVAPDQLDLHNRNASQNIKFVDLPKPKPDVTPRDVMMSVSMLRNQKTLSDEDDGPALVVGGPAERERRGSKQSIHFNIGKRKRPLHLRKRSGLQRRSFLFNKPNSTTDLNGSDADNEEDEEEDSGHEDDAHGETTGTGNNGLDDGLERARSHSQIPHPDQTGKLRLNKRSKTLDVLRHTGSFIKPPTLISRPVKKVRRRLSSNAISESSDSFQSDTDTDDEEDDNFGLRRQMSTNYLSWTPKVGRNSTFIDLSDKQKEEVGGVEYRAIKLLTKVLVCYYVGFHILAFLFFVPWIKTTKSYQPPVTESGVSLSWWGFFTSMSTFNDLGYTLTPNSMYSFNKSPFVLLVSSFFIIIGNTGFPILLRFIIWILFKFSRDLSLVKESLGFLLDHPRRCFTLLFPSAPTWWLLFILVGLNATDLILFIILDIGAEVLNGLTVGQKILDGFFQAVSTRTAGFACIDLSLLHPAVQVSYMVMMYISVLPVAISIRRTNVYEEQSLGVFISPNKAANSQGDASDDPGHLDNAKPTSFIGAHLRKQLSFDLWFVFLGLFIICIAEGGKIKDVSMPEFNVFRVMFEVVSAYGTVGLSLGYPQSDTSFSGQFNTVSKLVMVALVIRGRHRGLPYSLDRAFLLPSNNMDRRDKFQDLHAGNTLSRVETVGSANDPVFEFFKSAAPKGLRKHLRRPSFFSTKSSVGSVSGAKRHDNSRRGSSLTQHNNENPDDRMDEESTREREAEIDEILDGEVLQGQRYVGGSTPVVNVFTKEGNHQHIDLSSGSSPSKLAPVTNMENNGDSLATNKSKNQDNRGAEEYEMESLGPSHDLRSRSSV